MVTFGTWPNGTSVTASPFGSVKRVGAGSVKFFGVPGGGGDWRARCADTGARVTAANRQQSTLARCVSRGGQDAHGASAAHFGLRAAAGLAPGVTM